MATDQKNFTATDLIEQLEHVKIDFQTLTKKKDELVKEYEEKILKLKEECETGVNEITKSILSVNVTGQLCRKKMKEHLKKMKQINLLQIENLKSGKIFSFHMVDGNTITDYHVGHSLLKQFQNSNYISYEYQVYFENGQYFKYNGDVLMNLYEVVELRKELAEFRIITKETEVKGIKVAIIENIKQYIAYTKYIQPGQYEKERFFVRDLQELPMQPTSMMLNKLNMSKHIKTVDKFIFHIKSDRNDLDLFEHASKVLII